jgi:Family of unknown function (DUF6338)
MVPGVEALILLIYLMPGFIGMFVFESLAEIKRRQSPEKISLIIFFTIISISSINIVHPISIVPNIDEIKKDPLLLTEYIKSSIFYSSLSAIVFWIIFAVIANHRLVYKLAACIKLTNRTGSIDPWHQVFSKHRNVWVQIRFEDGSILVGWPKYYSEEGESREVFLAKATWHFPVKSDSSDADKGGNSPVPFKEVDVEGDGVLLSNFTKVKAIEILKGEKN